MVAYEELVISVDEAQTLIAELFGINGKASPMNGEIDFNFCIEEANGGKYILKVSRPDVVSDYLHFQDEILNHLDKKKIDFSYPKSIKSISGNTIATYKDNFGRDRKVRLLKWIDGKLFSSVKTKDESLLQSLGERSGEAAHALLDFNHELAKRTFDWDIANVLWVEDYLHLFNEENRNVVNHFLEMFKSAKQDYNALRKSTIHNDANDNNVLVNKQDFELQCNAIIDYGDAVFTQLVNDLGVTISYGVMKTKLPLQAAMAIVKGFNEKMKLEEKEIPFIYIVTALRLIISVTKSAINKEKEPDNVYLQISEKDAWDLLYKWKEISPVFAQATFRFVCDFEPMNHNKKFEKYASNNTSALKTLMPSSDDLQIEALDLSIDSPIIGNFSNYVNSEKLYENIKQINTGKLLVGGYGEARPIYVSDAYKVDKEIGYEHRTIHMGVDFWTDAGSPIGAIEDGIVFNIYNNDNYKDYGPTIILKHEIDDLVFYTLYGHLSLDSLENFKVGDKVQKGQIIGKLGNDKENGYWGPHLHFQIMLDMLDCSHDFYGVSLPSYWPIYKSICPDPNLLFKLDVLKNIEDESIVDMLVYRRKHLGKSLSISYMQPLKIVRGQMQYLIDNHGQQYLDTVNNVAHVGHEHPRVIQAATTQMQLLNTNTRYLNKEILNFAKQLLTTFPEELSVVHFVNSGSEANELALRMAKAYSKQKDIIALEIGYHGNTQGCIDISSYKFDGKGGAGCPDHTHIVPLPDAFRGMYRGVGVGEQYASHVKNQIEKLKSSGRNVAAFIAESIVSCGGQIDLPKGYLAKAYEYVRAEGGLCISDEVQVGFGRVGSHFWGFQLHDVVPDIVTLGKPIGNGHPLGAVVCSRKVADAFANGMEYFNTFGGNPVSCATGHTVLEVIKNENLQENALEVGNYLKNQLLLMKEKYPIIGDVRGEGLFLGIEFVNADKEPLSEETSFITNRMKEYRVLMSIDGPQHNVLKIKPPMCFNKENADYLLNCMERVIHEVYL